MKGIQTALTRYGHSPAKMMPFARFPMSDGAQWQTFEASAFFELKTVMSVLQYSFLHDAAKVQKANEFPKLFSEQIYFRHFSLRFTRKCVILHQKVRKSVQRLHKTELSCVFHENRKRHHQ